MRVPATLLGAAVLAFTVLSASGGAQSGATLPAVTYARDVAPILAAHCATCHRPGEVAPMSLLTYADVRPWAGAIALQVAAGTMPPWHAEAPAGTFENERRLAPAERDVIARWAAAGAPQGDPADLPAPRSWTEGWRIGTPDTVLEMDEAYPVPATGTVEYEYFYIPTGFSAPQWLQAIEVRPGNRSLVHHVLVFYVAPPDGRPADATLRLDRAHNRVPPRVTPGNRPRRPVPGRRQLIATYAPGTDPQVFREGTGLRLAPGGVLELQMHYTANGTAATDRTRVGMRLTRTPPRQELLATQFLNTTFTIPAGAADHEVTTEVGFAEPGTIWGLFPHTHVRGKKWMYTLVLPDGTRTALLSVPKYDFNWQTYYMFKEPVTVPRGATIVATAWYDNSVRNRWNPDPNVSVRWGDQTWEEMQYTGLLYSARPAGE